MTSEELKFLMMAFDHIQTVKANNPSDPNLTEIESLFYKHAPDYFSFQTLRLSEIYNTSLEETIKEQSKTFYNNFPSFKLLPSNIQQQLLDDYYQMEFQRRRNNFERFSQCIFQQIECITTHFWDNGKLLTYISRDRQKNSFSFLQYSASNKTIKANYLKPLVQSIIFDFFNNNNNRKFSDQDYNNFFSGKLNPKDIRYSIKIKIRAILYYVCFNASPFEAEFHSTNTLIEELYVIRNLFHRGPESFTTKQTNLINDIRGNYPVYFLRFYGLLSEFMFKAFNSNNLSKII